MGGPIVFESFPIFTSLGGYPVVNSRSRGWHVSCALDASDGRSARRDVEECVPLDDLRRASAGAQVSAPLARPGGSVIIIIHGERANFTRLVLGCIDAKFWK